MKGKELRELLNKKTSKAICVILATAIAFTGSMTALENRNNSSVPELVSFVDNEGTISIEGDETPLGAPKVTKSTKTSKKKKKIKMAKKSKKTYKSSGATTTKKSTTTSSTATQNITTETVVTTSVVDQYKKGSKIDTQVTTTTTTVTKTVLEKTTSAASSSGSSSSTKTAATNTHPSIKALAPKANSQVLSAYETLGFTVTINSSASYSGLFDARTRSITLKSAGDTAYHELGHFVAFVAGNIDTSSAFKAIYNEEKSAYKEYNKSYVLSSSSEYFAESFKQYTLNPGGLKASRPKTYAAIETALSKITSAQLSKIATVYGAIWK